MRREKFPFFKNSLLFGNLESNIAVCTLWTRKENIVKLLPMDKVCVVGNLYTVNGINYIIKNILTHPVIRYLIVCGVDLNNVYDVLYKLWIYGVEEDNRIKGTEYYLHRNIPKNLIDIVRRNVKLIDMRGKEHEIPSLIEKIYARDGYFTKPVYIPDEEVSEAFSPVDYVGFRFEGTLGEVWLNILDAVMKYGEVKKSEYGVKQRELLNILAVIKKVKYEEYFNVGEEEIERYCDLFFKYGGQSVEYTYGERLFHYKVPELGAINQIERIINKLREKPYTRRAVAVTWMPWHDVSSKNPPCLTQVIWSIKFGRLYQTCIFRSHDVYSAYIMNVYALRRLQEMVAEGLKLGVGDLTILSVSAHIYEYDWKKALEKVDKYLGSRCFTPDPLGYFIIKIENSKIIVQHYTREGRRTKYRFEGTSAEELYKKILRHNLVSIPEHIAYLGKELTKAEISLKYGFKYIQE